jgi:hypothetical protein
MRKNRDFFGRERPIKSDKELLSRINDMIADGLSLKNGLAGEIIDLTFAPNEQKILSHGLGAIPKYRLILRQTGNGLITDISNLWTDKTVGFLNNSANTVTITIKLFVE